MKKKTLWVLTLFPEYFDAFKSSGVIGKALSGERDEAVTFDFRLINIRDFADNRYKSIDDYPYGGGAGMVMRADILAKAITEGTHYTKESHHVVFPCPRGKTWNNNEVKRFSKEHLGVQSHNKDLVFICGRYEGIDERFLEKYVNEYISVGDYILSGGELATMTIIDSSLRFVEGILGNKNSSTSESFQNDLLEYPLYTKPRDFQGLCVPDVLLSGHHKKIEEFQLKESSRLTREFRPDLWERHRE